MCFQLEEANEEALLQLSDTIVACGYMGPIHVDQKKAVTEYVRHNVQIFVSKCLGAKISTHIQYCIFFFFSLLVLFLCMDC